MSIRNRASGVRRIALVVAASWIAGNPSSAEPEPKPELTVRYVWFTAVPKAEAKVDPRALPAVFQQLQSGWKVTIPDNAADFLTRLHEIEPRFTYRLLLSGSARQTGVRSYVISDGPRKDDPEQHTVAEEIRVRRWEAPKSLRIKRLGKLTRRAAEGGTMGARCDDTNVYDGNQVLLDTTQSMGLFGSPDVKLTAYVTCFQMKP